jgi:hypothetical protein
VFNVYRSDICHRHHVTAVVIVIIVAPLRLIHLLCWFLLLFPLGDAPKIFVLLPFSVLTLCCGLGF